MSTSQSSVFFWNSNKNKCISNVEKMIDDLSSDINVFREALAAIGTQCDTDTWRENLNLRLGVKIQELKQAKALFNTEWQMGYKEVNGNSDELKPKFLKRMSEFTSLVKLINDKQIKHEIKDRNVSEKKSYVTVQGFLFCIL